MPAEPLSRVPASAPLTADAARRALDRAIDAVGSVLKGHPRAVRDLFASVLARGHVLVEDVPGVGKTTLAKAVARALGTSFSRIQFTADMLPADVVGVQVLEGDGGFRFQPGPIFAEVVLADEINRASPKTQSAMLEAMAEGSVTVDDHSHALPEPFLVIATQNPVEHHGAYPLPESQLDRFGVSLSLGYPDREEERALLQSPHEPRDNLESMGDLLDPHSVVAMQQLVDRVKLADEAADYLLAIVDGTRDHPDVMLGCSPRGAVLFASMARARAFMSGRDFVLPDDIKALATVVLAHRLVIGSASGAGARRQARVIIDEILGQTRAPR